MLIAEEEHHAVGRIDRAGQWAGHIGPGTTAHAVKAAVQVGSGDQRHEVRGR
ncbi:hypothetical protein ACWGQ5_49685 [Streptomyces sp. NPDC055722]